jgi:TRAP-type C4-dicarboxylate transport system permease small subunit
MADPAMMSDLGPAEIPGRKAASPLLRSICTLMGSIGLISAMSVDALSVLGRHIGFAFLGSIEIVQACMVLAASAAMIAATLVDSHARVHILTDRLSPRARRMLLRAADLISALTMAALTAGSIGVASDLWDSQEITEILEMQLRWLRLVWIVSAGAIALIFLLRAFRRNGGGHVA